MPLFDLTPKESRRALYGRDAEVDTLVRLIENGRWSVILGPRMVGKTSLARAGAQQAGYPTVYVNLWGVKGVAGLLTALGEGVRSSRSLLGRVKEALRRIEGVSVAGTGVTLSARPPPLRSVQEVVNAIASGRGRTVVILDEVQELAPSSGALLKMLAHVFTTHPNVTFVFTGSAFGLIRTLLSPTATSPLFGRSPVPIDLHPFDRPTSLGFLERGCREYRLSVDRSALAAALDRSLDGIPGWLTHYGNCLAVRRMDPEAAEAATVREGRNVARDEVGHFLIGRDRTTYWAALRALCNPLSWSELRQAVGAARGSPPNDATVANLVRGLREAGLVEETDHGYHIPDPMIRAYVRGARRAPG